LSRRKRGALGSGLIHVLELDANRAKRLFRQPRMIAVWKLSLAGRVKVTDLNLNCGQFVSTLILLGFY
jgi:hypothetical protein